MKPIVIDNKKIGYGYPPYIIAEAGVNHNGRLAYALKLVEKAAWAGADAIKFQTFRAHEVTISQTKMAKYQEKNLGKKGSLLEMIQTLELNESWYPKIIKHCKKNHITFLSAPHGGFESVDFLQKINIPAFKIGSADLTNIPLLAHAARFQKPIILSTGMATMAEVVQAMEAVLGAGNNKIIALHCTTNYPCPPEETNLSAMQTMMKKLHCFVGYSDHTLGNEATIIAVALGACLIEKHITLDKSMKGPDHKASSEPQEFKEVVEKIQKVYTMLGSPKKSPNKSERKFIPLVRKSIVVKTDIKKGDTIKEGDLAIKRPGTGLAPKLFYSIVGKTAKRNIPKDTLLKPSDIQQ